MEYPTLFVAGTRWLAPWTWSELEEVTIHEAGHQFWYGIVATNEFEHAWMDEGLNTYATAKVMGEAFPDRFRAVGRYFGGLLPWPYKDVRWSREIDGNYLDDYRDAAGKETQATPSWQYYPAVAGSTTYDKTALWLATLERQIGWPTVQKILATYFSRTAFRHPTPEEFFAIASEVAGHDLTGFFDQVNRSDATFDYAVGDVTGRGTNTTVVIRRLGNGVLPVRIRITFDDGSKYEEGWDGRDRWRVLQLGKPTDVKSVEIDPDRVLLLDVNYTNNSWSAAPRAEAAARKWSLRWLTWLEDLLLTYASFA
jgi:aminopeptidase N